MASYKRFRTKFPGVFFREGTNRRTGKTEKIFYLKYFLDGKPIEEKAGRESQGWTAAKAKNLWVQKRGGGKPPRREKREAEREQKRVEAEAAKAEAGKYDLNRLFKEYLESKPGLKGVATDRSRYELHLKPSFGNKEPKAIIALDVDRLRIKLGKTHTPASVRNTLEMLRRLINFGVRKRGCEPLRFPIEMPRVHNLKTEDLTQSELTRLLEVIEKDLHPQAGPMMKLALFTAMRRGELFKLKWEDIDFDRGFISLINPKGGSPEKIPLNDKARLLLEGHPRTDSPYVFPGRAGEQRTNVNKFINRIKRDARLPKDFRPLHGLRHVFASWAASSGEIDLFTLGKLLTHKSTRMTLRYAHLRDASLRKASQKISNLFSPGLPETKEIKKLGQKRAHTEIT